MKFSYKGFRYEYWPWVLFFMPLVPLYLVLVFRTRKLLYFTAANPAIEMGGVFGESKIEILQHLPAAYLPATIFITNSVAAKHEIEKLRFPVMMKPDVGERGDNVRFIANKTELEIALEEFNADVIVQEYCDFEMELGIMFYRNPETNACGITSVTGKRFMYVTGNGVLSIEALMKGNYRFSRQVKRFKNHYPQLLTKVPEDGEQVLLEKRGNHCLGTEFTNRNDLINDQLVNVFDKITSNYKGFYFGRFDLKVKSEADLFKGEHIKIFELNGVTSEPGHIYARDYNLIKAYRDVAKQMWLVATISKLNIKKGVNTTPLKLFLQTIYLHFRAKKAA